MASNSRPFSAKIPILTLFILLLSLLYGVRPVDSIPDWEFESMLSALRSRGYDLFSNAIITSDLHYDLLSDSPLPNTPDKNSRSISHPHFFTLFAPPDSSLFSLDMTQTASTYTETLRLHVVPCRLSFSDLCRHSSSSLPTLLPSCALRVTTRRTSPRPGQPTAHFNVSVDDVDVILPGLYYGRYVAIHGLNSILSHRPQSPFPCASQRPVLSSSGHSRFRRKPLQDASVSRRLLLRVNRTTAVSTIIPITDSPQQHYTTASPVPDVAATNRRVHIPLVNHTTAEDEVIHRYSPSESPQNSGNSTPEDHIPETHCSSILLEAGNGDNGDEFSGIMGGQILAVARENRGPQNTSCSPTIGPRQRQGGSSSAGPT